MEKKVDYSLYVITDARLARGRSNLDVVAAALRGGATMIQYRAKDAVTRKMIEEGLALHDLCFRHGVPLIIDDRVDVALAVGAEGVHVGQEDMPASLARRLIGQDKVLGVSAANPDEAVAAAADGADYVGVGAVFATGSKADAGEAIGIQGLIRVTRTSPLPVVGIAGINVSNAASVIRAGAVGVAVISAVVGADDVEAAARQLRDIVDKARRGLS
ncbi:MAG: thiamine phosphate synthase [Chloroflexi bacterium]|nr:thiamine phosphate synthase [Chloroflexota bacterium]